MIRVEFYNMKTAPRARLTITTGDFAACTSVPVRPWLRMGGQWFVNSRKNLRDECEAQGVIVPSDDEIHAAIEEAWNAL